MLRPEEDNICNGIEQVVEMPDQTARRDGATKPQDGTYDMHWSVVSLRLNVIQPAECYMYIDQQYKGRGI